jgi:hypothetical protein
MNVPYKYRFSMISKASVIATASAVSAGLLGCSADVNEPEPAPAPQERSADVPKVAAGNVRQQVPCMQDPDGQVCCPDPNTGLWDCQWPGRPLVIDGHARAADIVERDDWSTV